MVEWNSWSRISYFCSVVEDSTVIPYIDFASKLMWLVLCCCSIKVRWEVLQQRGDCWNQHVCRCPQPAIACRQPPRCRCMLFNFLHLRQFLKTQPKQSRVMPLTGLHVYLVLWPEDPQSCWLFMPLAHRPFMEVGIKIGLFIFKISCSQFGNRQTNGYVKSIMPLHASLAWSRHKKLKRVTFKWYFKSLKL